MINNRKDQLDKDIKEEDLNEKIQKIMRQTDYTEEVIREKLIQNNYNEINVIKSYFNINEKKTTEFKSVNQEIYKQLRNHLKIDPNKTNKINTT
jgi:hypothetical protein